MQTASMTWQGGRSSGDDGDPQDWGNKWKEPAKHVGDGMPIFDEEDEDWQWCEEETGDLGQDCENSSPSCVVPEAVIHFPEHLEINSPHFRHFFFTASF